MVNGEAAVNITKRIVASEMLLAAQRVLAIVLPILVGVVGYFAAGYFDQRFLAQQSAIVAVDRRVDDAEETIKAAALLIGQLNLRLTRVEANADNAQAQRDAILQRMERLQETVATLATNIAALNATIRLRQGLLDQRSTAANQADEP